ncbi:uncharacterized protein A4U43_C02F1780 [Asparagus officinalis]|uniref:Uncharacterized protein n=1 Tax=Asparagus officinalis TaxID=4686 RepID=A0A5P1FK66_ASPOF|nr:uncharacterized protein A4U43_C02F1780 [Asparagus officinalis]
MVSLFLSPATPLFPSLKFPKTWCGFLFPSLSLSLQVTCSLQNRGQSHNNKFNRWNLRLRWRSHLYFANNFILGSYACCHWLGSQWGIASFDAMGREDSLLAGNCSTNCRGARTPVSFHNLYVLEHI